MARARSDSTSVLVIAGFLATSPAAAQMFRAPPPESSNLAPTAYKADIIREVRARAYDHRSIRDAAITAPFLRNMGAAKRYVVCFRYNGKNTFGGYTGVQEYMAVYVAGEFSSISSAADGECRGQSFARFAELEKLR